MVIYKAEFPNGKVYIGKTINFEMRLRLWIQKEIDFEKRGENIIHKLD